MRRGRHAAISCVWLAGLLSWGGPGCARQQAEPGVLDMPGVSAFDEQRAYAELEAFDRIYPRHATTPGALRAAEYLRERMTALGVESHLDSFKDDTPLGRRSFHNVVGRLPGTGDGIILLASHFDTKSGIAPPFSGANDSGSSTAVLLELARVLAPRAPYTATLLLVHFDGEECMVRYTPRDGLHGSRHLARQLVEGGRDRDVVAMILMDMVGDCDYTITIPPNCTPELVRLAFEAAAEEGIRQAFRLYHAPILDDHVPFLERGMPAVNLIDFEYGSAPGLNDYWHTPEDTIDKVCATSLGKTGRVVLRMLRRLMEPL